MFLATYIIGFYCIYKKNLEFIGLGLLYVINIFASIFCASNLLGKLLPMPVFGILCIILIFNIVAFTLLMISMFRVYEFSTKKGSDELILSPKNKKIVKLFKNLFVSSLVFIWTFLIIFFFHHNKKPFIGPTKGFIGPIKPFIDPSNFYGNTLITPMFEIFKSILLLYPFAVSIYLIVSMNKLAMLTRSLL
jgi:hypothetical protein